MTNDELKVVIEKHLLWLQNNPEGSRAFAMGANLREADLTNAYLRGANLREADLREADLERADLRNADLRGADLERADLERADLRGADLRGAKNIPAIVIGTTTIATDETKTGWKKLSKNLVCKISIPPEAKRSNATGRKCRCEFADVIEIWDGDKPVAQGFSNHNDNFIYEVGKRVTCDEWNDDRWEECGGGIHFFLTRIEAENY
jgi:hypothetical protein